ncbi:hypothetical protein TNCV_442791 [Trichonephila clavipes]|nr:hypothetical protein TNCV_442791 [Trichonephila clavipes]
MIIVTLKDLIIGSENYDEELTKNIHSTIVEDIKGREKKQEEQKEKLRIEEQREKSRIEEREERLRFEQLRLDEQKRKYEFELEKLRIQTQSNYAPIHLTKVILNFSSKKFRSLYIVFINTYFNGWIDGLKINTFNKLSDLTITDQLKRKTPFEFKEYYLDENGQI